MSASPPERRKSGRAGRSESGQEWTIPGAALPRPGRAFGQPRFQIPTLDGYQCLTVPGGGTISLDGEARVPPTHRDWAVASGNPHRRAPAIPASARGPASTLRKRFDSTRLRQFARTEAAPAHYLLIGACFAAGHADYRPVSYNRKEIPDDD